MTMLEIATPMAASRAKHSRNEVGMAKPTSRAERSPSIASVTIMTSAMAVSTEFSSWPTIEPTVMDWLLDVPTSTVA